MRPIFAKRMMMTIVIKGIGGIGGPFGQVLGLSTLAKTGNLGEIALYFGLSSGLFTVGALKLKKLTKMRNNLTALLLLLLSGALLTKGASEV